MVTHYQTLLIVTLVTIIGIGCYFGRNTICKQQAPDVFCEIIEQKKPAVRFAENDNAMVIASRSGRPLAIPKKHIKNLKTLNTSNVLELAHAIQLATEAARTHEKLKSRTYNRAYFHTGSRAGQTVAHLHMHLSFDNHPPILTQKEIDPATIAYENDRVIIVIEHKNRLRAVSKLPLPHLAELDRHSSNTLARILLAASQTINKQFPLSDYVTNIRDAYTHNGEKTLDIQFSLR